MGSPSPSKVHYHWIDWLRFLAAFGVLTGHLRGVIWTEWGGLEASSRSPVAFVAFGLSRLGYEAVIVFFVISGFLVGGRMVERVLAGTFNLRSFVVDRCTRIYVPLVPALLFAGAVALICGERLSVRDFALNLLGLQGVAAPVFAGVSPLWSLSYEIWFYVLAGAAAAMHIRRGAGAQWAFLAMAMSLGIFTKLSAGLLFCWLLGAVAYPLSRESRTKRRWLLLIAVLATLLGVLFCQMTADSVSWQRFDLPAWLPALPVSSLILAVGISILVACLAPMRPSIPLLSKVDWLGTRLASFSYTLYLTHYPVLLLWGHYHPARTNRIDVASLAILSALLAVCLLIAWLMYWLFEVQTTRVRHWLFVCLGRSEQTT